MRKDSTPTGHSISLLMSLLTPGYLPTQLCCDGGRGVLADRVSRHQRWHNISYKPTVYRLGVRDRSMMHDLNIFRKIRGLGFVLLIFVCISCSRRTGVMDQREIRDPLVHRALMKKRAHDIDGAIKLFYQVLARKPSMGRPHLELGLLLDNDREDYIRAIYHYEQYLILRPDAQKRDLIEQLIASAKLAFAASLPDRPCEGIREIADLKDQINRLKNQLDQLRGMTENSTGVSARDVNTSQGQGPRITDTVTPRPAPAQPAFRRYRVQPGDTLSSIARKMYNDANQWNKVFSANRDTLRTPEDLRVDQTILIPQ